MIEIEDDENFPTTEDSNGSGVMLHRPARPMLARDADSMYWMSRYVERAEHVARLLLVNSNLLIDVGDLAPKMQAGLWQNILTILRLPELEETDGQTPLGLRIQQHLTFNLDNPNSLLSCLSRARENARGIREAISAGRISILSIGPFAPTKPSRRLKKPRTLSIAR